MLSFEIVVKDSFLKDFMAVPHSTQSAATRSVGLIQQDPFRAPNVKKIMKHLYTNVYRVRLGDYRLVYAVGDRIISLLAIGRRGEIYKRHLGDAVIAVTGDHVQAAAPQPAPKQFATTPFDGQRAWYPEGSDADFQPAAEEPGPRAEGGAFEELLKRWGIPEQERRLILGCRDLGEILKLDLPESTLNAVQHWFNPPTLQQLEEQPDFNLPSVTDLDRFRDGTLTRFLLKLSPEQEKVAARSLQGPALVKGGPGTGKSLVALYRIRNLMDPQQYKLFEPLPRVLFLTFGRSLMNASQQLLEELIPESLDQVMVTNLDSLVRSIVLESGCQFTPLMDLDKHVEEARTNVLEAREKDAGSAWFALLDLRPGYLVEEIEWVINGWRIQTLEEYLEVERVGRGIPFSKPLRRLVWEVYQETLRLTADKGRSWEHYRSLALDLLQTKAVAVAKYDVVIVDEAQDLSPVSLAVCAELCKTPQGLFFTADANQSIYNRGFAWSRVHDFLDFRGRSTILKHNYRSTKQIALACRELLQGSQADAETTETIPVHEGPKPKLCLSTSSQQQYALIAEFLRESARALRLPVWTGTVLTYSNRRAGEVAKALVELGIEAKHVTGKDLHLKEKVVKVMTLHSSKGLEFPIVAVAHVEEDYFPGLLPGMTDPGEIAEHEANRRKLLFVGCSRAMRRLAMFANSSQASPYLHELSGDCWELVV